MPIQTQDVEKLVFTEYNQEDFRNRLNMETERLVKKGLKVAVDYNSNSCGFYNATVRGYKILKEW